MRLYLWVMPYTISLQASKQEHWWSFELAKGVPWHSDVKKGDDSGMLYPFTVHLLRFELARAGRALASGVCSPLAPAADIRSLSQPSHSSTHSRWTPALSYLAAPCDLWHDACGTMRVLCYIVLHHTIAYHLHVTFMKLHHPSYIMRQMSHTILMNITGHVSYVMGRATCIIMPVDVIPYHVLLM